MTTLNLLYAGSEEYYNYKLSLSSHAPISSAPLLARFAKVICEKITGLMGPTLELFLYVRYSMIAFLAHFLASEHLGF